jgi:hypothetical protein
LAPPLAQPALFTQKNRGIDPLNGAELTSKGEKKLLLQKWIKKGQILVRIVTLLFLLCGAAGTLVYLCAVFLRDAA